MQHEWTRLIIAAGGASRHLAITGILLCSLGKALAGPVTADAPTVFAPGIVSGSANDGSPTFTPDGNTLLFTRSGAGAGTIFESHFVNGRWTSPKIASFSGQWNDQHPSMAPNGSYLVFVSSRPVPGIQERVAHVWRVDRRNGGWGTPVHLPETVNIGPRTFAPSIAADNSIYFLEIAEPGKMQLYRARWADGRYQTAEALPFSSPATADVDPGIAPDQSLLIFASAGRRANDNKEHLYIVFNHDGKWGDAMPLRYGGDDANGWSTDNEPNLAPDGHTLYFSSDRSMPLHFPRTPEQARADLSRIESWDNGGANVWSCPFRHGSTAEKQVTALYRVDTSACVLQQQWQILKPHGRVAGVHFLRSSVFSPHTQEAAIRQRRAAADELPEKFPKLAVLKDEAESDVLAFMSFPKVRRVQIHSTNPLERPNAEMKRRTAVSGHPPERARHNAPGGRALLLAQNDEWQLR